MDKRGTNFYIKGTDMHIGKSTYAGLFCWKCKCTLAIDGWKGVSEPSRMLNNCPNCGDRAYKFDYLNTLKQAVYYEKKQQHKGIEEVMSFRWAVKPYELGDTMTSETLLLRLLQGKLMDIEPEDLVVKDDIEIYDEYGKEYSVGEFREEVLMQCPIQFFSIGEVFC